MNKQIRNHVMSGFLAFMSLVPMAQGQIGPSKIGPSKIGTGKLGPGKITSAKEVLATNTQTNADLAKAYPWLPKKVLESEAFRHMDPKFKEVLTTDPAIGGWVKDFRLPENANEFRSKLTREGSAFSLTRHNPNAPPEVNKGQWEIQAVIEHGELVFDVQSNYVTYDRFMGQKWDTSNIRPDTGEAYLTISPALVKQMTPQELKNVQDVQEILSEQLHAVYATPMILHTDEEIARGDINGKISNPIEIFALMRMTSVKPNVSITKVPVRELLDFKHPNLTPEKRALYLQLGFPATARDVCEVTKYPVLGIAGGCHGSPVGGSKYLDLPVPVHISAKTNYTPDEVDLTKQVILDHTLTKKPEKTITLKIKVLKDMAMGQSPAVQQALSQLGRQYEEFFMNKVRYLTGKEPWLDPNIWRPQLDAYQTQEILHKQCPFAEPKMTSKEITNILFGADYQRILNSKQGQDRSDK